MTSVDSSTPVVVDMDTPPKVGSAWDKPLVHAKKDLGEEDAAKDSSDVEDVEKRLAKRSDEDNEDNEDNEDSELVGAEDLEQTDTPKVKPSKWDNPDLLKKFEAEMEALGKVRFKKLEFTDTILTRAMAEVLRPVGGWTTYNSFRETVQNILNGPRNGPDRVPFSLKTRNQRTGRMDFWLIRSIVQIGSDDDAKKTFEYTDENGNSISKKTVLMSREFSTFLRDYCRTQLKDEVQFWVFTGSYRGKQQLDLDKFVTADRAMLPDQNPNNLVMVQFKMKCPQEMVGARN